MGLRTLDDEWMDRFMEFHRGMHPKRALPDERFRWNCLENPYLKGKPLVLFFERGGRIMGESLMTPFPWRFRGRSMLGYMNFDWHVLPEARGAAGLSLAMKTFSCRPYFGLGFSPAAERIWRRLGAREAGRVELFLWLRLPLRLPLAKPTRPLPVSAGGFRLARSLEGYSERPWKGLLEFSRPRRFLEWRFLRSFRRYWLYLSRDGESYFVLRPGSYMCMNMLVLADYRFPQESRESFKEILKVSKEIARKAGFDGIAASSSLAYTDSMLRKAMFARLRGKSCLIMTNAEIDMRGRRVLNRSSCLATMADSDMEFSRF